MSLFLRPRRRFFPLALAAAVLSLSLDLPAWAGFTSGDAGTSGAQFLKLGAGARAEGMAEAYTAVVDGADAIYWNPAALALIKVRSACFAYSPLAAGINYEFLGYGQKLGSLGGIGGGVQYVSQPGIDETDSSGFATGNTFHPSDLAAALGYAYTIQGDLGALLQGATLGATGKFIRSTITKSVNAYAFDLGYLSPAVKLWDGDFRLAYVAQNLGGKIRFQQAGDNLPTNLRLGSSYAVNSQWLLALDFNEPLDNTPYLSFGTEYLYQPDEETSFAVRAGVNTRAWGAVSDLSAFSIGFGGKFRQFGVDYAFSPMGSLGTANHVSVNFSF